MTEGVVKRGGDAGGDPALPMGCSIENETPPWGGAPRSSGEEDGSLDDAVKLSELRRAGSEIRHVPRNERTQFDCESDVLKLRSRTSTGSTTRGASIIERPKDGSSGHLSEQPFEPSSWRSLDPSGWSKYRSLRQVERAAARATDDA